MMKLREIEFGNVFCAACARNFSGEGWRQTRRSVDWRGSTLITKTVTLNPREGNMPLDENWQPREMFPGCIKTFFFPGAALNALGLSGPGIKAILTSGIWQEITEPFIISFMPLGVDSRERLAEMEQFVDILGGQLPYFKAKVALETNLSCPNVHSGLLTADSSEFIQEASGMLTAADKLGRPLITKINALVSPLVAHSIAKHSACDALDVSNTIPFGAVTDPPVTWRCYSAWHGLFGIRSPLAGRKNNAGQLIGNGGLSGKPLFPVVCRWLREFRKINETTPVIFGGGIFSPRDVIIACALRADAISLGTVAMLRPWRVQNIIQEVNKTLKEGKGI